MVSVNLHTTDVHANFGQLETDITVLNYMHSEFGCEVNITDTGDIGSKEASRSAVSGNPEQLVLEYQQADEIFGRLKGNAYGVKGNHDHPEIESIMQNLEFLEDGEITKIGGLNYTSATHYSGHVFEKEDEHHANLDKKMSKIAEAMKKADYFLVHESAIRGEKAPETLRPHKGLAETMKNTSGFGGHKHHAKVIERDNGKFFARGYSGSEKGLTYATIVNDDGSTSVYEIKNSVLIQLAEQIDPSKKYRQKDILEEKEKEAKEQKDFVLSKNPNFFTEREERNKWIKKTEKEFLRTQKELGISQKDIDRADLLDFIEEKDPEFFRNQQRQQEEAIKIQEEWSSYKQAA